MSKLKVLGLKEEKYVGQMVSGSNTFFEYYDEEMTRYHILTENEFGKWTITLEESFGECPSGWTTASWGHMNITRTKEDMEPTHVPISPLFIEGFDIDKDGNYLTASEEDDERFFDDGESIYTNVFTFSGDGGDHWYPNGGISVEMNLFKIYEKELKSETIQTPEIMRMEIMAKRGCLYIEPDNEPSDSSIQLAISLAKNIESLGFTLDPKTIEALGNCSSEQIIDTYENIYPILQKLRGDNVTHEPMYPGFPNQVMDMDEATLYYNASMHYASSGKWTPEFDEVKESKNFPGFENPKLTALRFADTETYHQRMVGLMTSPTSLKESDKNDLAYYIQSKDYIRHLPDEIPFKETAMFTAQELIKQKESKTVIGRYIKTPTDVLRLATAMSDGDISLAHFSGFKNFTHKETRTLLSLMEQAGHNQTDFLSHKEEMILLGEKLHPGSSENKDKYPITANNFYCLRNGLIENVKADIEKAIASKDWETAVSLLTTKDKNAATYNPGEFCTRLDKILRMTPDEDKDKVLDAFQRVSADIKPATLVKALANFEHRLDPDKELRCAIPKGDSSKMIALHETREPISEEYCLKAKQIICDALQEKFTDKPPMGKVYIDPVTKNYNIPATGRSASGSFHTVERGSRIDMEDKAKIITPFIYWKEKGGQRVDVDLSAVFYDKDMRTLGSVSYFHLKNSFACHSGDFVSARNGASEFVHIDKSKMPDDIKYIGISVNSYTEQPFSQIGDCFVGVQTREFDAGKAFDPKTVKMKIDLTTDSNAVIPAIIDVDKNQMVWLDIPLKAAGINNVECLNGEMITKIKAMMDKPAVSIETLAQINASARGTIAVDPAQADVIITDDPSKFAESKAVIVSVYDGDIIATQLLGDKAPEILPEQTVETTMIKGVSSNFSISVSDNIITVKEESGADREFTIHASNDKTEELCEGLKRYLASEQNPDIEAFAQSYEIVSDINKDNEHKIGSDREKDEETVDREEE